MPLFLGLAGIGLGLYFVGGFWGACVGFVMGVMMGEHEDKKSRKKKLEEEQLNFFMQQKKAGEQNV